jgi:hypothetical protein
MRTHVEFRSDKFPSYEDDVEGVNWKSGIYGKRLADYIVERLPQHGIEVARHLAEDWGWYIEIKHDGGFTLSVGCGHYQEYKNGFLCFVEPSKPVIRKWFKKIDTSSSIKKITSALDTILTGDREIIAIRWWDENEK